MRKRPERRASRTRREHFANQLRFEELEGRLMLSLTSDAPAPYPTATHNNAGTPLRFGPSQTVDDGVTLGIYRVGQVNASVTVDIQGSAAGRLDAWIDFNNDGSFNGPWEQVVNSTLLSTAVHNITFDIPSWAEPGATWARFRISQSGELGVAGPTVTGGEVEDYPLTILPTPSATGVFGAQAIIEDATGSSIAVLPIFAADIDNDGDTDVISATSDTTTNNIQWHRNNGSGTFTRFTIGSADDPRSIFAADMDGDNDMDLLATSLNSDAVYLFTNPGGAATGTWTRTTISSTLDGARQVFAADIDRDGDNDVAAISIYNDRVVWYQNNGASFAEKVVNTPDSDTNSTNATNGDIDAPVALFVADIDRDGQLDIVTSSSADGKIVWYQNDGTPDTGVWSQKTIKTAGAITGDTKELSAVVADIDSDGDMDIVTANFIEDRIAWYENDGTPAVGTWAQHSMSTTADEAYTVFAVDLDGDQDMDVLSASSRDDKIAWYKNNGSGSFTTQVVNIADTDGNPSNATNGNADGATNVFAADLNGDGDLDVISGSRIDNKVAWYSNPNVPGFVVTLPHDPLVVNESGTTDTFTVVLASQPSSNVTFDILNGDATEASLSASSITFTTANWNVPQTITVTGVNDSLIDGAIPSTITVRVNDAASDNNYDPLADQLVTVSTVDNDAAGFTVIQSGGTTQVSEGGTTDTFTVVLTAQPSSNVVLDVSSGDTGEATVSPITLTFTTANWNVAQTITVTGVNDSLVDGAQNTTITIHVNDASSDNNFDPLADQTVTVTTADNETAGFTVTQSGGTTQVNESGTTDTFTVVLTAQPISNVVFDISSSDTGEATASPTTLTFTSANWNVAQSVAVTGVNDSVIDGSQSSTITVHINDASSDNAFDPLTDQTVTVSTADNDSAGFTVAQSGGTTQVSESGTTDTFTVVLNAQPASNVVFDVSSGDTGEATVSPTTLTFTPANWNVAQTVTVTGVDDLNVDGAQSTTVTIHVNDAASDNNFDPLPDQTISASTADNDSASFTVTQSGGTTQVSENGTTDTFTVVLTTQPSSNVVFDISSNDTGEATTSPITLTFTSANWNVPQTATVTGVNDSIIDGPQTSTVTIHINDAASDNSFDPLPDQTVSVTTTDNDSSPQGDYDLNGQVAAADYSVFRNNYGSTAALAADGNASGRIDAGDYVIYRKKFGASGIAGAGAGLGTSPQIVAPKLPGVNASTLKLAVSAPLVVPKSSATNLKLTGVSSIDSAFAALSLTKPASTLLNGRVSVSTGTLTVPATSGILTINSGSVSVANYNALLLTLSTAHQTSPQTVAIDHVFATSGTLVLDAHPLALNDVSNLSVKLQVNNTRP